MLPLVPYDDDDNDNESDDQSEGKVSNHKSSQSSRFPPPKRPQKAQVIIRRPTRAPVSVRDPPTPTPPAIPPSDGIDPSQSEPHPQDDELSRIRALLSPLPIPGVENWGIPPESTEPCDPAIASKLTQFLSLKHSSTPKHFNDSLMSNRSFRNPHLYAQLVDFIDVDERASNFPKDIWDPNDVKEDWFADHLGVFSKSYPKKNNPGADMSADQPEEQKQRMEKQNATPVKRSHIDFTGGRVKEKDRDPSSTKKISRFQPYGSGGESRGKTRWG